MLAAVGMKVLSPRGMDLMEATPTVDQRFHSSRLAANRGIRSRNL